MLLLLRNPSIRLNDDLTVFDSDTLYLLLYLIKLDFRKINYGKCTPIYQIIETKKPSLSFHISILITIGELHIASKLYFHVVVNFYYIYDSERYIYLQCSYIYNISLYKRMFPADL
jgi:hypothetical protein